MPLVIRDFEKALEKKGFKLCDNKHKKYIFYYNGKKTMILVVISHSMKEVQDPSLINKIQKEMKLTKPQLDDFIVCPLTQEAYTNILIKDGFIY